MAHTWQIQPMAASPFFNLLHDAFLAEDLEQVVEVRAGGFAGHGPGRI
jgi:hypothetical protein